MRLLLVLFVLSSLLFSACGKESTEPALTGGWVWVIQYGNNPAYNSTPQSTGIQEMLILNDNGRYAVTQNGVVANEGAYKTATGKDNNGESISSIVYTNARVTDSIAYYTLTGNSDTLIFTQDLIGTIGSGARYYSRQ